MSDILDRSVRDWVKMAISDTRSERMVVYTTPEVKAELEKTAERMGGTTPSKVAHLAILFGLAALVKYWEESGEL